MFDTFRSADADRDLQPILPLVPNRRPVGVVGKPVKPPKLDAGSSDPEIKVQANTAAGTVVVTGVT